MNVKRAIAICTAIAASTTAAVTFSAAKPALCNGVNCGECYNSGSPGTIYYYNKIQYCSKC